MRPPKQTIDKKGEMTVEYARYVLAVEALGGAALKEHGVRPDELMRARRIAGALDHPYVPEEPHDPDKLPGISKTDTGRERRECSECGAPYWRERELYIGVWLATEVCSRPCYNKAAADFANELRALRGLEPIPPALCPSCGSPVPISENGRRAAFCTKICETNHKKRKKR